MNLEMISKAQRVVAAAKKPDNEEFSRIAKITGAGMVAMGAIGLAVSFIFKYV